MSLLRKTQQWGTFAQTWHIFDAKWQDPFQCAPLISHYLRGMHKPIFHAMGDTGDHVVIINSKEIAMRGDEWVKRVYFHHTGYHKGKSWTLAWELHNKDPTLVMKKAIITSMKNCLQRRYTLERVHIYPGEDVPEDILANVTNQIRQLREVPVRLDHIPEEVVQNFPRLVKFPETYIKK